MIDARYEKVRVEGKVISQAVLVVAGFTSTGRREVLHWRWETAKASNAGAGRLRLPARCFAA